MDRYNRNPSKESIPLIELVIISAINEIRVNHNGSVDEYMGSVTPYYEALNELMRIKAEYEQSP
ncbi:MAG: hypothetical protein HYS80_00045 [Candidatus Aenigmarchaeota archaeon]|nr:hypothetical protein [Candidatus Aenigmarchaeota archaeon]